MDDVKVRVRIVQAGRRKIMERYELAKNTTLLAEVLERRVPKDQLVSAVNAMKGVANSLLKQRLFPWGESAYVLLLHLRRDAPTNSFLILKPWRNAVASATSLGKFLAHEVFRGCLINQFCEQREVWNGNAEHNVQILAAEVWARPLPDV